MPASTCTPQTCLWRSRSRHKWSTTRLSCASSDSGYRRSLAALAQLVFRTRCLGHAFLGGTVINNPTRVGDDARAFVAASIQVVDTIDGAVAEALRLMPGASKREVALAALSELIYQIPQLLVRPSRMPMLAGPTLLAHISEAQERA